MNSSRQNAVRQKTSCLVHGLFQDDRLRGGAPQTFHKGHTTRKGDKDPHGTAEQEGVGLASRLLTKKELSDMAFSIRELSKRLGNYRLKMRVKNIFVLTKAYDESLIGLTRDVVLWLLSKESQGEYIVWVEHTLRGKKAFDAASITAKDPSYKERLKYWDDELCANEPHTFDIIVAVSQPLETVCNKTLIMQIAGR